jgi:hypothetical protein
MRKLTVVLIAITTILCLVPSGYVKAQPYGRAVCPPWYRGWQRLAPFTCGNFWGWPRYYYGGRHYLRHL